MCAAHIQTPGGSTEHEIVCPHWRRCIQIRTHPHGARRTMRHALETRYGKINLLFAGLSGSFSGRSYQAAVNMPPARGTSRSSAARWGCAVFSKGLHSRLCSAYMHTTVYAHIYVRYVRMGDPKAKVWLRGASAGAGAFQACAQAQACIRASASRHRYRSLCSTHAYARADADSEAEAPEARRELREAYIYVWLMGICAGAALSHWTGPGESAV